MIYFWLSLIIFVFGFLAFYNTHSGKNLVDFWRFCIKGSQKGFSFYELRLLWHLNLYANENEKAHFFSSASSLDFCIRLIQEQLDENTKTKNTEKAQNLLTKLYNYRTKFALELMQHQYQITTTHDIEVRQVCMLLASNVGSLYIRCEEILEDCVRFVMFDSSARKAAKHNWNGDSVQVYFWRRHDAGYFYISRVLRGKAIKNGFELYIAHSNELRRTQQRKSIRATCKFEGILFPIRPRTQFDDVYENKGGIKCIVKNISEDGAMIYVKGKAEKGVNMKLQFNIYDKPVVMSGYIVRFIYDEKVNTSKIHFNCTRINEQNRNTVLSFVYDIAAKNKDADINALLFENQNDEEPIATDLSDIDTSKLNTIEDIEKFMEDRLS
jgi:hypothetical protein